MKNLLFVICLIFCGSSLWAQPNLEIVWQKDLFPTSISDAKFSADGKYIYCAIGNNIHKMDAMTGEIVGKFENENVSSAYDMHIGTVGNYLVTRDAGASMNLWDIKAEKAIRYINHKENSSKDGIACVDISPDENYLLYGVWEYHSATNSWNDYILLYDIYLGKEINRVKVSNQIQRIQFSHDGKTFVTGGVYEDFDKKQKNILILWDAETLKQIKVIEDVEGSYIGYQQLKFSLNDKYLAVIQDTPNYSHIFDINQNTKIFQSYFHINLKSFDIELLPDNEHFLCFQDDGLSQGNFLMGVFKYPNELVRSLKYKISGGTIISKEIDSIIYIFNSNAKNTTLYRESTSSVTNQNYSYFNIKVELTKISIEFDKEIESIKVIDLNSKIIYEQIYENNETLKVINNTFSTGTYFCIIKSGNKEYSQKFQVVR